MKWNEKAVGCEPPMAGKCQVRTSFSTHLATDGSSDVADTPLVVPSPLTVSDTLTLTAALVVGFRSQQDRFTPGWCNPMTCCTWALVMPEPGAGAAPPL